MVILFENTRASNREEAIKCDIVWPEHDLLLNNYTYLIKTVLPLEIRWLKRNLSFKCQMYRYRITVFVMTFVLPSILMAYWNIRIGFVMKSSMTQLTEDGNQPQLQALLKKRKVKFWKQINLFVNTRLMDNKFLFYLFFFWGGGSI